MHEQHSEGIRPELPPQSAAQAGNIFVTKKRFPGDFPAPEVQALTTAALPRKRSVTARLLLPIALFVVVVGGIAWMVQYIPNWRNPRKALKELPAESKPVLVFEETVATWEPADKDKAPDDRYAKEFERGAEGQYDYIFQNVLSEPAELGLRETSCDCTSVQAAVLTTEQVALWQKVQREKPKGLPDEITEKFSWKPLERDMKKGIVIPGGAKGLVRVAWKGRKSEGQHLRLSVGLWMQPQENVAGRLFTNLETPTVMVGPLRFTASRFSLGTIAPGAPPAKVDFDCWSSTRSKIDLTAKNKDPLFDWNVRPLNADECAALEKKLRLEGFNTRVQCAFHINVVLHEDKEGKRFDQGPFERHVPLIMDGEALGTGAPVVHGTVHGDVEVGSGNDQGKINLYTFSARAGAKRQVVLWSKKGTVLSLDKKRVKPPFLKVTLEENSKSSTNDKTSWLLKVEVPSGCPAGPLPTDSAILIQRSKGTQAAPANYIRIPVLGTAVQS